jgi:hypothetical protein
MFGDSLADSTARTPGTFMTAYRTTKSCWTANANFEDFEVDSPERHLHIKAQTLRLYNPDSHQSGVYLLDLDKGQVTSSPVVGQFRGNRGEFFHQEDFKGRMILVRYVWLNLSPRSARMIAKARVANKAVARPITVPLS